MKRMKQIKTLKFFFLFSVFTGQVNNEKGFKLLKLCETLQKNPPQWLHRCRLLSSPRVLMHAERGKQSQGPQGEQPSGNSALFTNIFAAV